MREKRERERDRQTERGKKERKRSAVTNDNLVRIKTFCTFKSFVEWGDS
jgi:hypothetical protein